MSPRTTVFVSYSHADRKWLARLQIHLRPLVAQGRLELWDDTKLTAGDEWRVAIRAAIERAAASVLLISADFLGSDFVASEELPPLLDRAERAGARIIPIVVQPCRLDKHPKLAHFQALNAIDRPLSKLLDAEVEEVFVRAADQVERVLTDLRASDGVTPGPHPRSGEAFAELQRATVALSVLVQLATHPVREYSLGDLTQVLAIGSRRLAHETVDRLAEAGWLAKIRTSTRTTYRISETGKRQLERLADAAEGPLRQAVRRV